VLTLREDDTPMRRSELGEAMKRGYSKCPPWTDEIDAAPDRGQGGGNRLETDREYGAGVDHMT